MIRWIMFHIVWPLQNRWFERMIRRVNEGNERDNQRRIFARLGAIPEVEPDEIDLAMIVQAELKREDED